MHSNLWQGDLAAIHSLILIALLTSPFALSLSLLQLLTRRKYARLTSSMKQVFLVRHAQSIENVALQNMVDGFYRIGRLQSPTPEQYAAARHLIFNHDKDADVSERGLEQIADLRALLERDNWWHSVKPDAIFCSPLVRARKTCLGILTSEEDRARVQVLDCLREVTPYETIFPSTFKMRIREFERLLRNTSAETVVVVGHSQYFRSMLGGGMLRNCDLVSATASFDMLGRCEWRGVRLLYRSSLASPNPWQDEEELRV